MSNLAFLYRALGHDDKAEPLLDHVLEARERVLGREHPDTLESVNNLAALYFERGDWQKAADYWRRTTMAIADRTRRGAQALGQPRGGKRKSEIDLLSWQFKALVKAVHRIAPDGRAPDDAAAKEMFQTAQWALGSDAAQSLAQMAARGANGDPALAARVRERQDRLNEWERLDAWRNAALGQQTGKRQAKAEAENAARLAEIDRQIATIDETLKAEFPDYFALARAEPLSIAETQALLGADEALVLFLDMPASKPAAEETFIWVVTKTQMRWVRSDAGASALTREVQALRCGLDGEEWATPANAARCADLLDLNAQASSLQAQHFDVGRAHALYKALFGQVEDLIKDKHLLLVPSGPLTRLPFQVLIVAPPSGDYKSASWLIRDHAMTVLPAVSSLKALRRTSRASTATKPLIGFGNPLLDGPDDRYVPLAELARKKQSCSQSGLPRDAAPSDLRNGAPPIEMRGGVANASILRKLPPLPETADELCAVAGDIGADANDIHLGAVATEQQLKALSESGELAKYRVVHFATHGAMAGELRKGVEPGLILTPPGTASKQDDGYLSGSEIAALKLDADWVILSACNTAAGGTAGAEALSGLARAFIYAQARAMLVSHWAVDSNATVKLITAAMREIARDHALSRAEALRRAMLTLIDGGDPRESHPAYWAPFIVVGEGSR